ncbi:MAG: tripartite tricarboxylate transporter permease [Bacillota bacterium]
MLELLGSGFAVALEPRNLLALVAGALAGMIVGIIPGIGPSVGVALLLPFTYGLPADAALIMLASLYQVAEYGGSIPAILISTPGTPAAAATVLDGYALARHGQPGKALGYSITASALGGFAGVLLLAVLAGPVARLALQLGPAEFFAFGVFGLTAVISLASGSLLKGLLSGVLGLLLSTVGMDVFTGYSRFNLGRFELFEGIPLVPILIGLFAGAEALRLVGEELDVRVRLPRTAFEVWLTRREVRGVLPAIGIGTLVGAVVGVFPGLGAGTASWLAYNCVRLSSKRQKEFGSGVPSGIAAPESANNAVVGMALIPLLTLGIPGSPTAAVMMGALMLHGVQPGPQVFSEHPGVIYGLFASMVLGIGLLWALGVSTTRVFARAVEVPNRVMGPLVLILSAIGAFAVRNLMFDVWMMLAFSVLGYVLRKSGFSAPALVLAFVLGPMVESNLRRALLMADGAWSVFLRSPAAATALAFAVLSLVVSVRGLLPTHAKLTNPAAQAGSG